MAYSLDGRVAFVTGAGRGIGAEVARLLATLGAKVVVNDLGVEVDGSGGDSAPADQVVQDIKAAGGEAVSEFGDIADFDAARAMIRKTIDTYGKLDILVNVAGILRDRMIFNLSEDDWDAVVRVHLKGTFNTCRHACEYWRELRDEKAHHRIVNFTSFAGMHGSAGQPNYSAAKLGIVGLTYALANGMGRYGVTANAISPIASTRMTRGIPDARRAVQVDHDAPERSPANVAPCVAYLATEQSDWCTGQVISSQGFEIGLYNKPQLMRVVASPGPWEVQTAFEMMEKVFKPAVEGRPF
jgi:NAD(P)-dependent dehydrogenase (short-subunit alcohol dehydrogenase family)